MVLIESDLFSGDRVIKWFRPDGGLMQGPVDVKTITWLIVNDCPKDELRQVLRETLGPDADKLEPDNGKN